MLSRILLSVAAILITSTPVLADPPIGAAAGSIYQYQNFVVGDTVCNDNAGLSSILIVSHGDDASAIQTLRIENEQSAPAWLGWWIGPLSDCPWHDGGCQTKAKQWQDAAIDQLTEAESDCGIITVSAFLDAGGAQEQFIGSSDDLKVQGQNLGLAADQALLSTGNAQGSAINDADMNQEQFGRNGAGSLDEYSFIGAFQRAEVDGKSNTTVTAMNSMNVTTEQNQAVVGPLSGLSPTP